ncbi:MAG TPA: hypothetical protein VMW10_09935 [Alphaproteobacteria bacterium]|nr:hypothetical protein [Alphaproteobacteria bacterium]
MMNWNKEKPLIGTEGLIKVLHLTSSTDCWFIQSRGNGMDDSISDGVLDLIDSAPRRSPQMDSFVQLRVPIREIVEGLLSQWNRGAI